MNSKEREELKKMLKSMINSDGELPTIRFMGYFTIDENEYLIEIPEDISYNQIMGKCTKRTFENLGLGQVRADEINWEIFCLKKKQTYLRPYTCPKCKFVHLTSVPNRKKTKERPMETKPIDDDENFFKKLFDVK